MPLLVSHPSHHHQLNLVFSLPCHYINGTFRCNICHESGSKQWLYRCNLCGFDAHLGCATHATHHHQQPNAVGGFGVGVGRPNGQRPQNGRMYMNQLLGHLVSGTAGGITQGLLQGLLGGGSGSDGGTSDGTGGGYWG
uniref:DC1 domain-containing protein n=1 Tax=Rhizophora mucronata TaxID=61149 RepID=A0A2P2Q413_RHIMU